MYDLLGEYLYVNTCKKPALECRQPCVIVANSNSNFTDIVGNPQTVCAILVKNSTPECSQILRSATINLRLR